jgi:GNAT superfamily N-acetyltransferase
VAERWFDIVPADDVADEEVLDAIESAFGARRGMDWFRWKHREGPWGPSWGVVAVDDTGVIGVRLLLPWRVTWRGEDRVFMRATEAATVPHARGRGVFTALTRAAMDKARNAEANPVFFSTPNAQSREGYAKLGWTWVGRIRHQWCFPAPAVRRGVAAAGDATRSQGVATQWDEGSLRWRVDSRSGHTYRCRCDSPGAPPTPRVVYRVTYSSRVRAILPVHADGPPDCAARLLRSAARRERAPAVLDTCGPGAGPLTALHGVPWGGSLLAVWHPADPDLGHLSSWRLSMRELEAVF